MNSSIGICHDIAGAGFNAYVLALAAIDGPTFGYVMAPTDESVACTMGCGVAREPASQISVVLPHVRAIIDVNVVSIVGIVLVAGLWV